MKNQQSKRFTLVLISNVLFIFICYISGWHGQLQYLLSSVMVLWLLFIIFIMLVFYDPNNTDKLYQRFHDNINEIKEDNSNFKFIIVRLIMTVTNFQLTGNINWLIILIGSYSLVPLILFKKFLTKRK